MFDEVRRCNNGNTLLPQVLAPSQLPQNRSVRKRKLADQRSGRNVDQIPVVDAVKIVHVNLMHLFTDFAAAFGKLFKHNDKGRQPDFMIGALQHFRQIFGLSGLGVFFCYGTDLRNFQAQK